MIVKKNKFGVYIIRINFSDFKNLDEETKQKIIPKYNIQKLEEINKSTNVVEEDYNLEDFLCTIIEPIVEPQIEE